MTTQQLTLWITSVVLWCMSAMAVQCCLVI